MDETDTQKNRLQRIKGRLLDKRYIMPRDWHELNRLNLRHRVAQRAGEKNIFANQVRNPQRVLDVGCGTGKWCQEIAHRFQHASVIGLDINRIPFERAQEERLDPKFQFVEANALRGLPFPNDFFDYVHARFASSFIPIPRWPLMITEMVRVIRPGGWLEIVENGSPPATIGPKQREITQATLVFFERLGIGFVDASLRGWLKNAGLIQVQQQDLALRGKGVARNMYLAVRNLRPSLLSHELMTAEQFDALTKGLEEEMLRYQVPLPIVAVWGMKPLILPTSQEQPLRF